MDKSEDLSKNNRNVWNIQNIERERERWWNNWPQNTHTHSNGQFPLASKSLPLSSHTAFILTPLAKPNNIESIRIWNYTILTRNLICRVRKQLNILSQLLVRNAKQNWYYILNRFHLSRCCMIHECTIIKCQTETKHIVFHYETRSKYSLRL